MKTAKVTTYQEAYGIRTTLHNGEVFNTEAEWEAYCRGIQHALASQEINAENILTNSRIRKYDDRLTELPQGS